MKQQTANQKIKEEYFILTEILEEVNWALEGECNDIDCDRYMYKDLLKKKYKPVLEHNFSCMEKLNREKSALMRLLSLRKFRKLRYTKCHVCKKSLDKLSEKSTIVSFTKLTSDKKFYQWDGVWAHNSCSPKVKIPKGWERFR